MAVAVDVFVKDMQLVPEPIEGATVTVFDLTTLEKLGSGVTDADGKAAFLLPGGTYEVRAFKRGVIFANPWSVEVLEPDTSPNLFELSGTVVVQLPPSTDPGLCRVSATVLGISGQPQRNVEVLFTARHGAKLGVPLVMDGRLVRCDFHATHTDDSGFVSVELVRKVGLNACVGGGEETLLPIRIPDRPAANLMDLLYPYPVSFHWDEMDAPGASLTLDVDDNDGVAYWTLLSDDTKRYSDLQDLLVLESSDESVARVEMDHENGVAVITGVSAGTCTISVTLKPLVPARIPTPVLSASPLTVTVTSA